MSKKELKTEILKNLHAIQGMAELATSLNDLSSQDILTVFELIDRETVSIEELLDLLEDEPE